ncbi:hypothetical protein KL86PLE_20207 [uncultured Pleomorphomonas sp.]|uniref:Uncharacterized protein n=1 Tax=uncultured Pleomorphomonas sp. TaxID=442121 RepID=A0A212LDI7_9HYPH|nr:hypothetical protein KL86PLE_20207 [uncultured Pleomorphomonas sp.]
MQIAPLANAGGLWRPVRESKQLNSGGCRDPRSRRQAQAVSRGARLVAARAGAAGRHLQRHRQPDRVQHHQPVGRRAEAHPRRAAAADGRLLRRGRAGGRADLLQGRGPDGDRPRRRFLPAGGTRSHRQGAANPLRALRGGQQLRPHPPASRRRGRRHRAQGADRGDRRRQAAGARAGRGLLFQKQRTAPLPQRRRRHLRGDLGMHAAELLTGLFAPHNVMRYI